MRLGSVAGPQVTAVLAVVAVGEAITIALLSHKAEFWRKQAIRWRCK